VRFEPLDRMLKDPDYGVVECEREGFPDMTPAAFVANFRRGHLNCREDATVAWIAFYHVADPEGLPPTLWGARARLKRCWETGSQERSVSD
jgi:hypothetical protein